MISEEGLQAASRSRGALPFSLHHAFLPCSTSAPSEILRNDWEVGKARRDPKGTISPAEARLSVLELETGCRGRENVFRRKLSTASPVHDGFDLGDEDLSQLECTAQAGRGFFFNAENADELSAALIKSVETPMGEIPNTGIELQASANGEPAEVIVTVPNPNGSEPLAEVRTYRGEETNPRRIPLPPGSYDIEIRTVSLQPPQERTLTGIEVSEDGWVHRHVEFDMGRPKKGSSPQLLPQHLRLAIFPCMLPESAPFQKRFEEALKTLCSSLRLLSSSLPSCSFKSSLSSESSCYLNSGEVPPSG